MELIKLYCDGGCRGNGSSANVGGYGAYMEYWIDDQLITSKEIKGGERNTTNNQMELKAAIEGMKAIKNKTIKTIVYLDSKYVKEGLSGWLTGWRMRNWKLASGKPIKNKELWIELDGLRSQFWDISYEWVKGHGGNEGNEKVDSLTNEYMDYLESEE